LLEKALDENGNDLDSAVNSLNELCRGYVKGNSGEYTNLSLVGFESTIY
ncbi:hypothetical protein Tco_1476746, partial [Tanacetum coccineum]